MQPVSGYSFTRYTVGPGTEIVSPNPIRFHSIITFGTVAGTTSFYDTATKAGTSATNRIFTFNQVAGVGTVPQSTVLDLQTRNGLVVVNLGTSDYLITVG